MKTERPKNNSRSGLMLPKWAVPLFWGIIILAIHFLLPWAVSRLGPNYGWIQGNPAWWNLAGLIPMVIGLALYIWCLVFHFRTYRTSVRFGFSPPHLVTDGPYQLSRNPMYLSALFAWLGWVVFYGSPAVLAAFALLWSLFAFRVVPQEERQLRKIFGEEYTEYQRSVGRWIGKP
jgi:protein-S-isoprenylcysteine O-methyltransferase Ste14